MRFYMRRRGWGWICSFGFRRDVNVSLFIEGIGGLFRSWSFG